MRWLYFALLLLTLRGAFAVTDAELAGEVEGIKKLAAQDSPRLAVPALLRAVSVMQPHMPAEAQMLLTEAAGIARANPGVKLSHSDVRLWMKLDPDGGEAVLRKLPDQGGVLDALAGYKRSAALAAEAIEADLPGALVREFSWRLLASAQPRRAVELFGRALEATTNRRRVMEAARALVDGLLEAEAKSPAGLPAAATLFGESRIAAVASGEFTLTLTYEMEGRRVTTRSNTETVAAWQKLLATGQGRAVLRGADTNFVYPSGSNPPPVDATLPLEEAMPRIQTSSMYLPETHVGELWRYLLGQPRSESEARPILAALVNWAETSDDARDPFWFVQALLNLDGRGPRWQLPPALRPTVFAAAARLGHRVKNPSQLQDFAEAMVAERQEPPSAGATSAALQYRIAKLAAMLEPRFDFALPTADGARSIKLSSLRGKAVVLAFGRAPMPLPTLPVGFTTENAVLLAITDRPGAKPPGVGSAVTVLVDQDRRVYEHYRVMELPRTIVLDAAGRLLPAARNHF